MNTAAASLTSTTFADLLQDGRDMRDYRLVALCLLAMQGGLVEGQTEKPEVVAALQAVHFVEGHTQGSAAAHLEAMLAAMYAPAA